jgi:tRNA threonylcarbamoyladenosine biosynthesis protein TsaE
MKVESAQAMHDAGLSFAARLKAGDLVTLTGGLGAGKTLFCKGVLAGLGFEGDVTSPTFSIVHPYAPPEVRIAVMHADLYRLDNPEDIAELGLLDGDASDAVRLVEWAERGGDIFARADYRIMIDIVDETRRELSIEKKEP